MADEAAALHRAAAVASAVPTSMLTPSGVSTPGAGGDGPATGTVTPALSELPADQVEYSLKVSLADLCAKAAVLYSQQKNYEDAAELYARAAEMQAEMNGEMNPDNAEILFLYGRALFKVGQSKSDVLGGKAPDSGAAPASGAKATKAAAPAAASTPIASAIKSAASGSGGGNDGDEEAAAAALESKKPLFQFTGDEEWDASDDEHEDAEDADREDEEEEDDDLAVAFEVLDLSRVLFEKQLEEKLTDADEAKTTEAAEGAEEKKPEYKEKGKAVEEESAPEQRSEESAGDNGDGHKLSPALRHIMERLADTHDLLAEISLENERYPNAIVDSRASLSYKKKFLSEESELIAEAHFKLSLALEFASVTTASGGEGDGDDAAAQKDQQVDQELRDEAARELEAAIASTRLKLQNKEVELATLHSPEDNESTRRQIAEVKDIIADMEQRLVDLRKPPIDLNAAVNGPASAAVSGLLGALSGGVGASESAGVEEAKKTATDLTGLVRKKAKDAPPAAAATADSEAAATANGGGTKRKAQDSAVGDDGTEEAKKARTEAA